MFHVHIFIAIMSSFTLVTIIDSQKIPLGCICGGVDFPPDDTFTANTLFGTCGDAAANGGCTDYCPLFGTGGVLCLPCCLFCCSSS
ncbi:hypothetical protein I4U23_021937 [Adineta vaga]|nr:hypothetical protein I4U23_021937 [Adineta vaga]